MIIPLYKKMHYTTPPEVDHAWPV